jgi:hypothetical protein
MTVKKWSATRKRLKAAEELREAIREAFPVIADIPPTVLTALENYEAL